MALHLYCHIDACYLANTTDMTDQRRWHKADWPRDKVNACEKLKDKKMQGSIAG